MAHQRLLLLRLVAPQGLNSEQIAVATGAARSTVFRNLDKFLIGGLDGNLQREHKGGQVPTLAGEKNAAFAEQLRAGKFRSSRDA